MFDGFIRDHARWTPRAPAVILPGRQVSYAQFDADIDRLGAALADLGVVPDAGAVAVALEHPYLQLLAMAALARLGVASAPAADPGCDLRLTDPDAAAAALAAPHRPLPVLELDPDALGRVTLSSGATPRRIGLSWRQIEIANFAWLRTLGAGRAGAFVPVTGLDSPLGFALGVCAWSCGAAVAAGFAAEDLPRLFEALPAAGVAGMTPVHLRRVLGALPPGFRPQPGWRLAVAGALLPVPLAREALARLTPDVRIVYDAAACSLIAYGHAADLEDHPGQVGITPAGAILEVVDDDGRPRPDGQSGQFRITAGRMTRGYLGDPQATAERFHDGWFHTGDVGRRLPDGRLVLEGRAGERLRLADGRTLMPQVLETAAFACPGVVDCAAFAAPDLSRAGLDQCWLAVAAPADFDRDSLARHLARFADLPPPRFAWIDEIPRNAMGKVERSKLRDLLLAALTAPAPPA